MLLPFFIVGKMATNGHPDDFTKWTEIWHLRMARCRHVPPMPQSLWFKVCCLLLGAPCLYTRSYLDDKNFYEAVEWMLWIYPFFKNGPWQNRANLDYFMLYIYIYRWVILLCCRFNVFSLIFHATNGMGWWITFDPMFGVAAQPATSKMDVI